MSLSLSQVAARQATAKACRCFYLAESYSNQSRYSEAQALYSRSAELMDTGVTLLQEAGYTPASPELISLGNLELLIDGAKARAHAQAFVTALSGGPGVAAASAGMGKMDVTTEGIMNAAGRPLIDSAEDFSRPKPEYLVPFPPDFVTVPCKPVLFDIARNQLAPPDLSGRFKAKRGWGSSVRSLFGRS